MIAFYYENTTQKSSVAFLVAANQYLVGLAVLNKNQNASFVQLAFSYIRNVSGPLGIAGADERT
jgi:hypothetical protein